MRETGLLVLVVVAMLLPAASAVAATPDEAVSGVAADGVFVAQGATPTEAEIGEAVAVARNAGVRLSIVVLRDEPVGGATTFADAVADAGAAGLVLVVAPESIGAGGFPGGTTEAAVEAALDAAVERGGDDARVARTFADSLATGEPGPAGSTDDGGGGGNALLWLLVIVAAGGVFMWWLSRRAAAKAAASSRRRLAAARAEIQERIDAVANDILELEDEVQLADDPRVDRFFEQAGGTYRTAGDALAAAQTPEQFLEIANDLDEAIWRLDCVEAILDGNPQPGRPVRRRMEPSPSSLNEARRRPAPEPAQPEYRRRPTRRSSYSGSGLMDVIAVLGASVLSGRANRSRTRSSATRGPSTAAPARQRESTGRRIRSGRRRRR